MSSLRFIEKNAEAYLINFLLFNIVLWVFVQVIMRYIFSSSLPWSEEFVRWCFIWFIWVGVSYGFKTRRHICVTALINGLPPKAKAIIGIITNLLVLWCMVKLFLYGWKQVSSPIITKQSSIVLYWPLSDVRVGMQWLYASLPIGALLSSLRLVQNVIVDLIALKGPSEATVPLHSNIGGN
jgi:TRAP-type C4-dicarboxylate transport system permease small subunit